MRTSRWIAAVLFAAGLVAVIEAQPPGGRGFGGGFGGGDISTLVLSNEALQDELKVTGEQKEKFRPLAAKQQEMQRRGMEIFKEAAGDKDKMKEMFAEQGEKMQAFQEEVKKAVEEALNGEQKARLKQIDRQRAGLRAFAAEDVAAGLKLTDEQKGKIKGIGDDLRKDMGEMFGKGGGFGKGGFDKDAMAENQKKMEKLNKAAMAEVDEVLTADQKKAWKEMVGAPFDTAKLNQFGGFGGGQVKGKGKGKAKD